MMTLAERVWWAMVNQDRTGAAQERRQSKEKRVMDAGGSCRGRWEAHRGLQHEIALWLICHWSKGRVHWCSIVCWSCQDDKGHVESMTHSSMAWRSMSSVKMTTLPIRNTSELPNPSAKRSGHPPKTDSLRAQDR